MLADVMKPCDKICCVFFVNCGKICTSTFFLSAADAQLELGRVHFREKRHFTDIRDGSGPGAAPGQSLLEEYIGVKEIFFFWVPGTQCKCFIRHENMFDNRTSGGTK